jgi:hypothetical protein
MGESFECCLVAPVIRSQETSPGGGRRPVVAGERIRRRSTRCLVKADVIGEEYEELHVDRNCGFNG